MRSIFAILILFLFSGSTVSGQSWGNSVQEILQAQYSQNNFEGLVLLAVDHQPKLEWSCGFANRDSGKVLDINTRFALGEITQYLTALEILILVEEERISLSDTISTLLPHLSLPRGNLTTVEHLLRHTSGYPQELEASYAMRNSPRIIIERALEDKKRIAKLGTYTKSNLNYLLLGMIIEETTAQSWKDAMSEDIIGKLSLENTGFLKWDEYPENWADGHTHTDSSGWSSINLSHIENYFSAGAMYSTVKDLLLIDKAIQSGKLPNPMDLWTRGISTKYPKEDLAGFRAFNYPFSIDNPLLIERYSNFSGTQVAWIYIPSSGSTIVIMSNVPHTDLHSYGNLANIKEQLILKMTSCGDYHIEPCEDQIR
ncbi:serine hydrolase domain-containing protein [Halocola ammonii]